MKKTEAEKKCRASGCQWFGCKKEATIIIPRANTMVCNEHYTENLIRFSCDLKGEIIEK